MDTKLVKFKKRLAPVIGAVVAIMATPIPALAVTVKSNLNPETVVGKILDYLLTAGQLVGGGVIIFAGITFALSISQENPDQQARAIKFFVAGAFLVGLKAILKGIGVIG